ncbi:pilus assembly protein PilP [Pseudomonas putida]|uniref:Type IV pili biogenesis protein n=1 Tax=Pseudomonas parafulva TaxID=157782 RepID=A0AAJ0LKY1_9PSED|nr:MULTISPECIES: pilus assembly protein PilP [Pseudomonas]KTT18460.1 type IV pili biogenesis protein [Pseudomonas parafulva]MBF8649809.1 pilus assembly protein PilP [Pseudomonas putida]MBF8654061.1 pilus assembly protein PilP [Pseudomonas putida]MBF8677425.1 pilus assembly protein PilP [Pseudomonas fulva]MBF8716160.1 pilus assembly protein PilP [Pseudomonas fulva]
MKLQTVFERAAAFGQSARAKSLAPVLLACCLFILGCAIRLPAALQQMDREQARAQALDERQSALNAERAGLDSLRAAVAEAEQRLQVALWSMAAGQDMSDLVDHIAALGRAHGLLIELLRVQEAQTHGDYQQVPLELRVKGEYAGVRQWLFEWLGQARLLRTGDMSLEPVTGQPGMVQLRLQVDAFQATVPTLPAQALAQLPARMPVAAPHVDPFRPQQDQLPDRGLASVPLSQVRMVGSLSRAQAHEALLMAAGKVHRVRLGDRVGRDQGVVAHIDPGQVEIREHWFMDGAWHERVAFISMATPAGKEALILDEQDMEMATRNPAVAVDGNGRPLPG